MTLTFSTKAETLKALKGKIKQAEIFPCFIFTYTEWIEKTSEVLTGIRTKISKFQTPLIVRSSAKDEDNDNSSNAGKYLSIGPVTCDEELSSAVANVFASYGQNIEKDEQILVQPFATDVAVAGVIFTKEPATGSPYYVINYDESGKTDSVTSGNCKENKLKIVVKGRHKNIEVAWCRDLIRACEELENLFNDDSLDIEFLINAKGKVVILQVRRLIISNRAVSHEGLIQELDDIHKMLSQRMCAHPYLYGKKTIFGVMPDWNPAEIIGTRPKPLALSLYKELVTDSVWAYQRHNYGYKQLRSFPLIVSFAGQPYIDVRVSFNSFVPQQIDSVLGKKLVDYYIDELCNHPEMHDKVEFEIVVSCMTFDWHAKSKQLIDSGFEYDEINVLGSALLDLTNNIICSEGLWSKDIEKINQLPERRKTIIDSQLSNEEKIYWLIEDCKRYGTLPFAGLARAAFIAVQILESMCNSGLITLDDKEQFMASLKTVSKQLTTDQCQLSFEAFIEKYGHLRPGTYDICSPTYDESPELYFDKTLFGNQKESHDENPFSLTFNQLESINEAIKQLGLKHDVVSLFKFIRSAVEGREYAKFVFTHSLSNCLSLIKEIASETGVAHEDMAMLDIKTILAAYSESESRISAIKNSIANGEKKYRNTLSLCLPALILHPDDIYNHDVLESEPNFVTLKKTTAYVTSDTQNRENLSNKIVCIPSADPGYDWLFSQNISGLVTLYGGANSHMAIRANELSIPSIIGAGEILFNRILQHKQITIDAANRKVEYQI